MAIEVEAVVLGAEAAPNVGGEEAEVGGPAGRQHHDVDVDRRAVAEPEPGRRIGLDRGVVQLDDAAPRQAVKIGPRQHGRFAESVDLDRCVGHQTDPRAETRAESELEIDQRLDEPPIKPGERSAQPVDHALDRGGLLIGRDERAGQAVEQAPLERQDAGEPGRQRPVRLADDTVGLGGDGGRFERRVGGALAVAEHRDAAATQLIARVQPRDMHDLAAEVVLAGELRHVWQMREQPDADDDQIEVVAALLAAAAPGDRPARTRPAALGDLGHLGVEADARGDAEVGGEVIEVLLDDRARREIGRALGQRPIGNLVELTLDLQPEVGITVPPNAAQHVRTLEQRAVEALGDQRARGHQPRHPCADDADRLDRRPVHHRPALKTSQNAAPISHSTSM